MRVLASLSTVAATTVVLSACGLGLGGLGDNGDTDSGPTLDGAYTAEGGSSSNGSSGGGSSSSGSSSGSGDDDGSTDGTVSADSSGSGSGSGGPDSTAPPQDSSVADSSAPVDSSMPDTYVVDTGTTCTTANNCYVIPASWQLVAFTTGTTAPTASCPTGFAMAAPTNLDEGPNTSSACQCGQCAVSSAPTCPTGPITVDYDVQNLPGAGQCGTAGNPSTQKNATPGGCNTDMYTGNIPMVTYETIDLKYTPPAATGGSCTSAGTPTGTVSYTAQDRTCVPDSQAAAGCTGNQCTLTLASPYEVCIVQSGAQTCPGAPFTHSHTAGGAATFTCSACGCNVSASCTGTMELFTSNNCTTTGGATEDDIAVDGACHPADGKTGSYNSYEYVQKAPTISCAASGTSTATNVTLANVETICCTQ
ncbi:MAG: hypothetical protein ABSE49_03720 [Polyangiaceae bacterium]|jgi:hypothetical protein